MSRVEVAFDQHVATVTVNRPEVLNALDIQTIADLDDAVTEVVAQPGTHVVVFRGAGSRAFIAGGDIADLESRRGLEHYGAFAEAIHRLFRRIEKLEFPTISAVRGHCLGGGVELLLSTDIRVLSTSARLGLPEITLGLFPGAGGSQRLPRQIPLCAAKFLMFTGEVINAEEAVRLGLANEVVSDEELDGRVAMLAASIASKSPLVLKLLKRAIAHGVEAPLDSGLAYEQAMIALVLDSQDAHEGCRAFLEKRVPKFNGK